MFPGRWPNNPDSMWNSAWSMPSTTPHQTFVPHAQFCGGDPSYQQCQAQTQAQIQALQQKNALLNQQLYNQSMTHINHLQPLIPHQQTPQPSTIPTPPIHPTPPTPQSQPEPPTVTSPSPPPTPPAFNPEEMINQMKMTFKEGLAAAVEIANERHSQHSSQPTPPTSHNDSHLPPTSNQLHNTTQFPRRSRPLHRSKELAKTDKRAISTPRSPRRRPRSSPPSTKQRRDYSPQKGRDSSVTLRSVSPNRWSSSYDLDREVRTRYIAHKDTPLVLLNLILHSGINRRDLPRMLTLPIVTPITRTPPHGQNGITTWGKWGNQQSTEKAPSWHNPPTSHSSSYHHQSWQEQRYPPP